MYESSVSARMGQYGAGSLTKSGAGVSGEIGSRSPSAMIVTAV